MKPINPDSLGAPRGYSNGILAPAGARTLYVAGQIAWDRECHFVSADFGEQFAQALRNVLEVVREAGGRPEDVAFLRIYVVDKHAYNARIKEVGKAYRELMGRHYPAMALVEVKSLLEDQALVEIEAVAMIKEES